MESNVNFNPLISLPESSPRTVYKSYPPNNCKKKKKTNKTWCAGFELADMSLQDPALTCPWPWTTALSEPGFLSCKMRILSPTSGGFTGDQITYPLSGTPEPLSKCLSSSSSRQPREPDQSEGGALT